MDSNYRLDEIENFITHSEVLRFGILSVGKPATRVVETLGFFENLRNFWCSLKASYACEAVSILILCLCLVFIGGGGDKEMGKETWHLRTNH